jgi:hypothetical protein
LESGALDPALIAEFNTKLKAAGLDKIITEKQKQIDAWAKTANNKKCKLNERDLHEAIVFADDRFFGGRGGNINEAQ